MVIWYIKFKVKSFLSFFYWRTNCIFFLAPKNFILTYNPVCIKYFPNQKYSKTKISVSTKALVVVLYFFLYFMKMKYIKCSYLFFNLIRLSIIRTLYLKKTFHRFLNYCFYQNFPIKPYSSMLICCFAQ